MKKILPLLFILPLLLNPGCKSNPYGSKVKDPFSGNAYESNNRFFRGVGKGESSSENIAKSKADMNAKKELAGQVNTTMKQVADQYLNEAQNENAADVMEQFESLTRQVMNTQIADLRKMGEKKYYNGQTYTIFMAYEIKKRAMFRFMKKQAKLNEKMNDATRKAVMDILEEEIQKAEE